MSAVSKTILVSTRVVWIFAIVGLLVMGQTVLAVITTVTFMMRLYMVIPEYLKLKKNKKLTCALLVDRCVGCQACQTLGTRVCSIICEKNKEIVK